MKTAATGAPASGIRRLVLAGVAVTMLGMAWGGEMMNNAKAAETATAVQAALAQTDPELAAIRGRVLEQIRERGALTGKQRALVGLAALVATGAAGDVGAAAEAALEAGCTPVQVREALYQCAPYVGFPRVEAALSRVNALFAARGVALPLEDQGTVTEKTRFEEGLAKQKHIFGDAIDVMHANAPQGQKNIVVEYLTAFCFGDFYTRKGLDLKERELIVFTAIVCLGGCDPQARAHATANVTVGNTKQELVDALAVMLPVIGFPRTLNGLAAVNAALPD